MHQRINITLPEETVRLIDKITGNGNRSQFIDEAVKHYIDTVGRKNLHERLKQGAVRRSERDLQLVEEWASLEEEVWQKSKR
jgi:CopG family transcriptional regulator / antitoxin EndoAI